MLLDTKTGRGEGTLTEEGIRAKVQKLGINCIWRGGV